MSDKPSAGTDAGGSGFQAAKDAVASAAEQVRASAPGAYDAGAKAAHYVGEATADHPVSGWRNQTGDWQKRGYELSERARTAAPAVSQAAADAGQYVAQNVREHPLPGAVIAGAVVCMLGYLLYRRD